MSATASHLGSVPAGLRIAHVVGLGVFVWLMAVLAIDVATAKSVHGIWWTAPLVALVGYLLADFVSGFVHFIADNFAEADTPIIGPTFVRPFREHHVEPLKITQHGFVEANGNNVLVSLPVLGAVVWFLPVERSVTTTIAGAFAFCFIFSIFLTNQFHKWAHMPVAPPWVVALQRTGLILSKSHHDVHHTSPYNTYYCITVGVWNPLLDRTRFFDRLERFIRRWVPGTDPRTRVEQDAARAAMSANAGARA